MARTRYGTDRGLSARMVGTMFGIGLLYVVLAAVLISFGVNTCLRPRSSAADCSSASGGSPTPWRWRRCAPSSSRPEQAPQLHAIVDRICAMADMDKPRVGIADSDVPNAFATGRSPKRSVIVVTTGLLKRLDQEELEGVLAHELSHVAHRDVTVMAVASFTAIVAGFMMRSVMWGGMGRNRDQNTAVMFLVITLVSVVVYFLSYILMRALSRYRELGADRGAALLTGQAVGAGPRAAEDLRRHRRHPDARPAPDGAGERRSRSRRRSPAGGGFNLESILSTHPSLEKRLEQLAQISAELGER